MTFVRKFFLCVLCTLSLGVLGNGESSTEKQRTNAVSRMGDKPWLVIDYEGSVQGDLDAGDFPQLLVMQLAKAGVFRCVEMKDADFLKRPDVLDAMMSSGDRVSCISWIIRNTETPRGRVLTISIGYRKLFRTGRGELLKSQDVLVRERGLKGFDLMTFAAKKSARAILFELRQPQVLDLESTGTRKTAIVDYGRDFFEKGESVDFIRRKTKNGRTLTRKVGTGVVSFADVGSTMITLKSGEVKEDDFVMPVEEELERQASAEEEECRRPEVCQACKGRRSIRVRVDCADCNGQGKRLHIKGRSRDIRSCIICGGRGWRSFEKTCPDCKGTGRNLSKQGEDSDGGENPSFNAGRVTRDGRILPPNGNRGFVGKKGDFTE